MSILLARIVVAELVILIRSQLSLKKHKQLMVIDRRIFPVEMIKAFW